MTLIKSFDIKRLKPYHRERYRVPNPTPEIEEKVAALDPDLKPEEHAYVNHYLGYADVLLHQGKETVIATPEFADNVVEMPQRADAESSDEPDEDGKAA